jgi:hypothetical protein
MRVHGNRVDWHEELQNCRLTLHSVSVVHTPAIATSVG